MTNTVKLQGKMRENGFTIKKLAKNIGLSPTGLFNKIHNKQEFVVSEIQSIGLQLALTNIDIQDIFFASYVELNSTKS
jgi:hypothetical protein